MKITIKTDVYHQPNDLSNHEYEPNDKQALCKQRLNQIPKQVIRRLPCPLPYSMALLHDIVIKINLMNGAQLNLLQVRILEAYRTIVVIHEGARFHFGYFIEEGVYGPFRAAVYCCLLVLAHVVERVQVMVIVRASVTKCCYQAHNGASLSLRVN